MARPPFWRMTIWIDVIFFGPFYLCRHLRVHPRPELDPGARAGVVRHDAGQRADHPDGRAVRRDARARTSAGAAAQPAAGCCSRSLMISRMRAGPPVHRRRSRRAAPRHEPVCPHERRVRRAVRPVGAGRRRVGGAGRRLRHGAGRAAGSTLILVARRRSRWPRWPQRCPTESVPVVADLATEDGLDDRGRGRRGPGGRPGRGQRRVLADRPLRHLDPRTESLRALDLNCRAPLRAGAPLPAADGRAAPGRIRRDVLAGRAAGLAADQRLRRDQGVRRGARRGAVGGAARHRRRRGRLRRRRRRDARPGRSKASARPARCRREQVAAAALRGLGRGPRVVPGWPCGCRRR